MKPSEAADVLKILAAGFPQEAIEPATGEVWVSLLQDLEADATMAVILRWIKTESRFPTMAQLRLAVRSQQRRTVEERERLALNRGAGPIPLPEHVADWLVEKGWA